jgi:D-aminoacyl-tRNA deacylase
VRAVVQRVTSARVRAASSSQAGETIGEIGPGLCVLVGVTHNDDAPTAQRLAEKLWNVRIFDDDAGVMNVSAAESGRPFLVVSQFTLYGSTAKGRRPSWAAAARPEHAAPILDAFVAALRALGAQVATGRFGADMHVELVNDGPVTLLFDL